MRVLMVVRPATGGMKGQVALLSRGLVAWGVDVEVAAPEGSDILVESIAEGLVGYPAEIVGPLRPPADFAAARELKRIIAEGDYDLVHAHGFKAGLVARLGARGTDVPVVITAHNHVLRRQDFSAARTAAYRVAERAMSGMVARWIAVSESVREELTVDFGLPSERVVVVPNAIDLATFLEDRDPVAARLDFGIEDDAPLVGVAARLAPQKGLDTMIDALPVLLERVPDARLLVAGSGPLEADLRVRAVALGVADAIVWAGQLTDMPGFYAALDVFVSPSDLEGFSLTLAEAQATATPIVSTHAGGAAEVVLAGSTAVVVEPGNPFDLGIAVARLLGDEPASRRLGDAGRRRAIERFNPERMVAETLAVYEDVVGPQGAETVPVGDVAP